MKYNILFIMTTSQRYDTIHAHGNDDIITPNIDGLAAEGVSFFNAYNEGGLSDCISTPSRAATICGRSIFGLKGNGETILSSHTMLGEALKSEGFFTYGIGKWDNGAQEFARCFAAGTRFGDNKSDKNETQMIGEAAVEFIKTYDNTNPFFCFTAFSAPQRPFLSPQKYVDLYEGREIKLPKNYMREYYFDCGVGCNDDEKLATYPRTRLIIEKELKEYYAMITHLDFEVGRIIDALKQKGVYDNTIIVFTSDTGLAIGSHALMGNQSLFEHCVKVPLIICGGGLPQNKCVKEMIYLYDIFPTLLEMLKIQNPKSVQGKSFLSTIKGNDGRRTIYHAYGKYMRCIRQGNYKLICYRNCAKKVSLYNLASDPFEERDMSKDIEFRPVVRRMRKTLMRQHFKVGDIHKCRSLAFWFSPIKEKIQRIY